MSNSLPELPQSGANDPGPIPDGLAIREVHASAWRRYARHHYLKGRLAPVARVFEAALHDAPAGIVVYAHAGIGSAMRRSVLPAPLARGPLAARLGHMRDGLRILHRLVVLPGFRGIGVGSALVRATVGMAGVPFVECVSRQSGALVRAGFEDFGPIPRPRCFERVSAALTDAGVVIRPFQVPPLEQIARAIARIRERHPTVTRDALNCIRWWAETHRPALRGGMSGGAVTPAFLGQLAAALACFACETRYSLFTHPAMRAAQ